MHVFALHDEFALMLSCHMLHLWYALDHSENLQLYHYAHHQTIDSVYSIYIKLRFSKGTKHREATPIFPAEKFNKA